MSQHQTNDHTTAGNPLLLTRSEAAGQPRARQVGRNYAATYVILDAVNRARDAATAAQAGESPPGERAQEAGVHVARRGKGCTGGGADGVGGGGLGVVMIASDDESLSKTGGLVGGEAVERRKRKKQKPRTQRVPKEQTTQQQEQEQEVGKQQQRLEQLERGQAGKRVDPDTGGLLEGADGLLDLGEEVGEETLSPKNTLNDEEVCSLKELSRCMTPPLLKLYIGILVGSTLLQPITFLPQQPRTR